MSRRELRKQLEEAWKKSVLGNYRAGRINSERSLQASFWGGVWGNFADKSDHRTILVEPKMRCEQKKEGERSIFPDFVICNSRRVIGIVEIKYHPKRLPRKTNPFPHDFTKLANLSKFRGSKDAWFTDDRFLGPGRRSPQYYLASEVLFVWCGFYKSRKGTIGTFDVGAFAERHASLHKSLLTMHAVTSATDCPQLYFNEY